MAKADRTALMFGALLHDIGKVLYRGSSGRGTHSKLGADFLSEEIAPRKDSESQGAIKRIVEQVRYHHAREMAPANLAEDSLAYITYFADNISAGMDRKNEGAEEQGYLFKRDAKLRKIFNILNGHHDDNVIEHEPYDAIREHIRKNLLAIDVRWDQVNSLVNLLEATVSTVPSSTDMSELVDVSLFDHSKTAAGIAACIYDYLREQGVSNYREALFDVKTSAEFYARPMFLLYSCDMSGIQSFIYNISGDGALKQLRARSMYLELLVEHIVDELLDHLELSRTNLLYTGGGHAYLLLPNTQAVKERITAFNGELETWFVDRYRNDLYLASAWVECSSDDLANKQDVAHPGAQRYRNLYRRLSRKLSDAKANRYGSAVLRKLNFGDSASIDHSRECSECHRSDLDIDDRGRCTLCAELGNVSNKLVRDEVFVISEHERGLELPFGKQLVMYSKQAYLRQKPEVARVYTKNEWDTGLKLATHIWMGDYEAEVADREKRFSSYAARGATSRENPKTGAPLGVKRLGVLRADVDNLGATFVNGLPDDKASISRSTVLSRSLNHFFKAKINKVLEVGGYQLQIIYSGGDDLFIVGNWSDVIHAAMDIHDAFAEFVGNGAITISAGIGIFDEKFPIARMAAEAGELEDEAKLHVSKEGKSKDAIALWTNGAVFSWEDFVEKVAGREAELQDVFESIAGSADDKKGNAFIYQLVGLLRSEEQVSTPRLAYLLARSFEGTEKQDEGMAKREGMRLYDWAQDPGERQCLVAALEWYVYGNREGA
ncbi:type III-A CRISPR-associated protein Cas10/Csm1 [uncultured Olsenella sp.]|uniref:type III-A CRISPR-associated protein Cas10/Csm1 n=1 Tax=uncultured Olsenella sp. TaxID=190764 RepID=UPI0026DB2A3C|nr:type III-A CRISPR-associated protein Cas10/Csm1 [uncultured Olsenella sp.]